ncbi:hypothetical protein HmCmsJML034_04359 [Escherichia coli]|nr:hypothetical protein HmCmsJML034_04359 [Escherichia coli]
MSEQKEKVLRNVENGYGGEKKLDKFTMKIGGLLCQWQFFINLPFFQTMTFLIGEGVFDSVCHTFGNLAQ